MYQGEKFRRLQNMTSNELKDALSRRLNKADSSGSASPEVEMDQPQKDNEKRRVSVASEAGTRVKSPVGLKTPDPTFRSGWSSTPPIHRSTALPYGQFLPGPPLKNDKLTAKPSAEEINYGMVDQRRKDLASAGPPVGEADTKSRNGPGTSSKDADFVPASTFLGSNGGIIKEGSLLKFSSGALTSRWQKRYFILNENGLEYFGNHSQAFKSTSSPSVSFPIHRIKSVSSCGTSGQELELVIGKKNCRQYQLKASSGESCKEWIYAIQEAIHRHRSSRESATGSAADSIVSADDMDGDSVLGGSSLNDNSSIISTGDRIGAAATTTLWEQPEVSVDDLDALFSEWFIFLEDPTAEVKAGRMIDASSRAVSDLWAVLGKLPRGEDVVFEDAKKSILMNFREGRSSVTIGEYVMRLCQKIIIWLNRRPLNPDEIPVVIEWMCRLKRNLESLTRVGGKGGTSGSSSPTHSDGGSILSPPERFSDALRMVIRKLGSEWEIGLIEFIQRSMPSESVWDLPPVVDGETNASLPRGPFLSSSTLLKGGEPASASISCVTTSWSGQFMDLVNKKCISRCTPGDVAWQVAFPTCCDLLTEHACSIIVAVMNACHREFKKRASLYTSHAAESSSGRRMESMLKKVKGLIATSPPAAKVAPEDYRPPSPPPGKLSFDQEHMLAFGNEATLVSVCCQHVSNLSAFTKASSPAVFAACLEELSQAFAHIANEVSRVFVKVHFLSKNAKLIRGAFDPKQLAVRIKVPIAETLEEAKRFITQEGCHELLKYLITGHLMQGVANAYVTSLVTHKPKITKFTRLAAVVAEDEGLFFALFKELGRPPAEINTANDQISHIRIVLAEKNIAPPSRGGIPLVHECVELTKAIPSSKRALELVKALLYIKGINKADRKDILYSVTACMQRNIQSPSPALLDLSREDEDDDDSGISSNKSESRNRDESF